MATLAADMHPPESDDRTPLGPPGRGGEGAPPLGPLPSGRHPYTPEQVATHQRERLIAALAALVAERGYAGATVGRIAAAAHVSRRVFYEHFDSKEACFLAAFDTIFEHLRAVMREAVRAVPDDWPRQVVAALRAALGFFAANPDLGRLCLVESPSAGPALQRRFAEIAAILDPYLRLGRAQEGAPASLPESTEASLLGAVAQRLNREIGLRGSERLPELLPELVEFVLTPYLGAEAAARYAAEADASGEDTGKGGGG